MDENPLKWPSHYRTIFYINDKPGFEFIFLKSTMATFGLILLLNYFSQKFCFILSVFYYFASNFCGIFIILDKEIFESKIYDQWQTNDDSTIKMTYKITNDNNEKCQNRPTKVDGGSNKGNAKWPRKILSQKLFMENWMSGLFT